MRVFGIRATYVFWSLNLTTLWLYEFIVAISERMRAPRTKDQQKLPENGTSVTVTFLAYKGDFRKNRETTVL